MTCTESCHSASCPSQLSSQPTGRITAPERGLQCQGSPGLQRPVSFEGLMSVNMLLKPQRTRSAFALWKLRSEAGPGLTTRPGTRHPWVSGAALGFGSRCEGGHTAPIPGTVSGHSWPSGWVGSVSLPHPAAHVEGPACLGIMHTLQVGGVFEEPLRGWLLSSCLCLLA